MCVCISSTWDCKPFMTEGCFWNGGVLGVCCTNLASRITSFTNPKIVSGGTRSEGVFSFSFVGIAHTAGALKAVCAIRMTDSWVEGE